MGLVVSPCHGSGEHADKVDVSCVVISDIARRWHTSEKGHHPTCRSHTQLRNLSRKTTVEWNLFLVCTL